MAGVITEKCSCGASITITESGVEAGLVAKLDEWRERHSEHPCAVPLLPPSPPERPTPRFRGADW